MISNYNNNDKLIIHDRFKYNFNHTIMKKLINIENLQTTKQN